jgi:2'-5' RNA ligase
MPADVGDITTTLSGFAGSPWTADRIHLIHSRPGQQPRFEMVGSWPLGAAVSSA